MDLPTGRAGRAILRARPAALLHQIGGPRRHGPPYNYNWPFDILSTRTLGILSDSLQPKYHPIRFTTEKMLSNSIHTRRRGVTHGTNRMNPDVGRAFQTYRLG